MNRPRILSVAVFAALCAALLMAGCGGGGGGREVTVRGLEYAFEPAEVTVPVNQEVKLTFRNTGSIEHSWTIEGMEGQINTGFVQPGQTKTITFTITRAGEYVTYCDVPGHRQLGMVGKLTAQ